jgi:hypothetical protein
MPEKPPPNPNGKSGKPLLVPLPFDEAIRAALETPPEPVDRKPSKRYSRKKK